MITKIKLIIFVGGHFENGPYNHFRNGNLGGDMLYLQKYHATFLKKWFWRIMGGGGCSQTYFTCPTVTERRYCFEYVYFYLNNSITNHRISSLIINGTPAMIRSDRSDEIFIFIRLSSVMCFTFRLMISNSTFKQQ